MNKHLIIAISIVFASITSSCIHRGNAINKGAQATINHRNDTEQYYAIKKFVDGDTFWVDNGIEKRLKIRLIGVDTPEARKYFNREIGYYGKEAAEYVKTLLINKKVKLVLDVDPIDRYGRTLAYVYLEDGTFLNADLVKNGYATVMTVPPNVKFSKFFLELQQEARNNNRGLWNLNYNE